MEKIGHYTIVSELGRGGMGVVYKAHEESLNRHVALKVLGEHLADDESYVQRFLREAQSAAKLNHPNIVQVYATGRDGERHFIALEYISGTSLQKLLRDHGKMDSRKAARIILQTAAGLEAAHEAGIVHRDIKPANILLTDRGLVKIADFGLALLAGGASRLTATGMFMGTPGYLSPEQCLDRDVDHRTDIYSLGVTFFEMLTGGIPFKADSPLALLRQIIEVEPPDVRDLNPEVDEATRSILKRMMVKDKNQRYPSCRELISDLQQYLEGTGTSREEVSGVVAGTSAAVRPGTPAAGPADATVRTSVPSQAPAPGGAAPTALMTEPSAAAPVATAPAPSYTTSPTVMAPSGGNAPPAPPTTVAPTPPPPSRPPVAPPPITPSVPAPPAPSVEVVHTPPPKRRAPVALIVTAVALFGVIGIAAAVGVAWKVGLFGRADATMTARTTPAEGEPQAGGSQLAAAPQGSALQAKELEVGGGSAGGAGQLPVEAAVTTGSPQVETSAQQATDSDTLRPKHPEVVETGSTTVTARQAAGSSTEATAKQLPSASRQTKPPVAAPPPQGVAVVAVGERLLAGEAESFIEGALAQAGVRVVAEQGLAGGDGDPRALAEALRPHAHYLILVDAEFLGERQLQYMGRYDTAYQARLQVRAFDLQSNTPVGGTLNERVEYTQLSVGRVVEEKLRPHLRKIRGNLSER